MEREDVMSEQFDLPNSAPDSRQAMRIVTELTQSENGEFPTDPEERYAAILSSIGNNAGKQITFLSIPNIPNTVITPWELHTAFLENSQRVWKTGKPLQKNHTFKSLIPIGMVAEEVGFRNGIHESTVGFTQTEAGRKYGDPIARFLLKYASEHNVSLEKILGVTGSNSNSRAPYNRARILEYLDGRKNDSNIRIVDIHKYIQSSDNTIISAALTSLQDQNLVVFDSLNVENTQGNFTYALNPEFEEISYNRRHNLATVFDAIKSLQKQGIGDLEIDTILSEVQKSKPGYKRAYARQILSILAHENNKYLVRTGNFKGGEAYSTVTILQEGEEFVGDVLKPLRVALTDTPDGEELRREWRKIAWQNYAPKALQIHRENSGKANKADPAVIIGRIREIISENPGIRTSEIEQKLKELGLPYKDHRVLNKIFESGEARKVKEGRSMQWYPVDENAQDESI